MTPNWNALLVGAVAVVVVVGSLGLVVGVPGLDGSENESDDTTAGPNDDSHSSDDDDEPSEVNDGDDVPSGTDDSVEFDHSDPIEFDPGDPVIAGTADIEAETELEVRLASAPGEQSPFFTTEKTTADEEGLFAVKFDLSNVSVEEGTDAEVVVQVAGEDEQLGNTTATFSDSTEVIDSSDDDTRERVELDHSEPVEFDLADPVISGTADVEAETELTVRLVSVPGEQSPFFTSELTPVTDDGTFEVEFELGEDAVEPDTQAEVVVTLAEDGEQLEAFEAIIVEQEQDAG